MQIERVIANLFAHGDSSWLHKDCESDNAWTIILYLNEAWDPNWHGGTVLFNTSQEPITYFAPTPGKFVLFKSNLMHGPVPVSREAPYPRFGLTFQCKTNDSDIQRLSKPEVSAVRATQL